MKFNKLMKVGLWSMIACTFFGSLPLLIALAAGVFGGEDVMNEATGSGTWLWLMHISLPLAFVLGIVGFVIFLIGVYKSRPEK
jgi:uncharacterized membrane protein YdjX (TVP38/TMEM64 family)